MTAPNHIRFKPADAPTMDSIVELVAARHGVTPRHLMGRSTARSALHPRQEAMAEIYAVGCYSYPEIGAFFDREHPTVMRAVRRYLAQKTPPAEGDKSREEP